MAKKEAAETRVGTVSDLPAGSSDDVGAVAESQSASPLALPVTSSCGEGSTFATYSMREGTNMEMRTENEKADSSDNVGAVGVPVVDESFEKEEADSSDIVGAVGDPVVDDSWSPVIA